MEHAHLG